MKEQAKLLVVLCQTNVVAMLLGFCGNEFVILSQLVLLIESYGVSGCVLKILRIRVSNAYFYVRFSLTLVWLWDEDYTYSVKTWSNVISG